MRRIPVIALMLAACSGGHSDRAPSFVGAPAAWIEPGAPSVQTLAAARGPVERFTTLHPGAWDIDLDPVLGTPRSISGPGFAFDTTDPETAAYAFYSAHGDLFGTDTVFYDHLSATNELVYDGATTSGDLTSIVLLQRFHGVPVLSAHLGLVISHGRLVLVQGTTYPLTDHVLDAHAEISLARAIASARHACPAPHAGDRDDGRLVIVPERTVGAVHYRLAWEVTSWRADDEQLAYVDAHDGRLVVAYDGLHYGYPGAATNRVDARTVGDDTVTLPAGFMQLYSSRGLATTDQHGAFAFPGEVGPLIVTAHLRGTYVDVHNKSGDNAAFVGLMNPDRAYGLEWDEARSLPEERDVFRAVNQTNRFVATVFPTLAWIAKPLPANVNLPRTCNAYWNGMSINFFAEGKGCNNTGRIFDVVAHEWGHGLDQAVPGADLDGGLGEFIGDMISFVQTNSPLVGPGFLTNGRAVRDLQDPAFRCYDPKKRGVHAAGQLLGTVMWDVFTDLKGAGVTGEALKRLMILPIAGAQTRAEWYRAMLAVDDDNGNLADGTPHECLIYNQFKAHSCAGTRWPGIPDEDPPQCRSAR